MVSLKQQISSLPFPLSLRQRHTLTIAVMRICQLTQFLFILQAKNNFFDAALTPNSQIALKLSKHKPNRTHQHTQIKCTHICHITHINCQIHNNNRNTRKAISFLTETISIILLYFIVSFLGGGGQSRIVLG